MLSSFKPQLKVILTSFVLVCFVVATVIGWNRGWFEKLINSFYPGEVAQAQSTGISVTEVSPETSPDRFYLKEYSQSDIEYHGEFVMQSDILQDVWVDWILTEDVDHYYYFNRSKEGVEKIVVNKNSEQFELWETTFAGKIEGIKYQVEYIRKAVSEPRFETCNTCTLDPSIGRSLDHSTNPSASNEVGSTSPYQGEEEKEWSELTLSKVLSVNIENNNIVQQVDLNYNVIPTDPSVILAPPAVIPAEAGIQKGLILTTEFNLSSKKWTWTVANPDSRVIRGYWETEVFDSSSVIPDSDQESRKSINGDSGYPADAEFRNDNIESDNTHVKSGNMTIDWSDFVDQETGNKKQETNDIITDDASPAVIPAEAGIQKENRENVDSGYSASQNSGMTKVVADDNGYRVYFYPNGTKDDLVIDPYLSVSDESTYFKVQGGNYQARIYKTDSDIYIQYYDVTGSTYIGNFYYGPSVWVSSTSYLGRYDTNRVTRVTEHTASRILIEVYGKFDSTYGGTSTYLTDGTNDVSYHLKIYYYTDYLIYDLDIAAGEGFTVDTGSAYGALLGFRYQSGQFDSSVMYRGDELGTHIAANYGLYDTDYGYMYGATGNYDIQLTRLFSYNEGTVLSRAMFNWEATSELIRYGWSGGTIAGDARLAVRVDFINDSWDVHAQRAKVIEARNQDIPGMTFGGNDTMSSGEITLGYNSDGSNHIRTTEFGYDINDKDVWLYWDMDSATDGVKPQKGNSTTTISGNIVERAGKVGNGLKATDDTSYARYDFASGEDIGMEGRIGFWHKPEVGLPTTTHEYFWYMTNGSNGFQMQWRYSTGDIQIYMLGLGTWTPESAWVPVIGQWYFHEIAWKQVGSNMVFYYYRNGELIDTNGVAGASTWATNAANVTYVNIMKSDLNHTLNQGVMDELYISDDFSQTYVQNEVKATLHAGKNAIAVASSTVTFVGGSDTQLYYDENATTTPSFVDPNGSYTAWATVSDRKPYGAYDVNDPNVLFYWDMNSTTTHLYPNKGYGQIDIWGSPDSLDGVASNGIGSFADSDADRVKATSTNNISLSQGRIGFWLKLNVTPASMADHQGLFEDTDASGDFYCHFNAANDNVRCEYNGNSIIASGTWQTNSWYWLEFIWDATNDIYQIIRDGQLMAYDTDAATAPTSGGTLVFGNNGDDLNTGFDGTIDEIYISKNPNQPNIPSFYDVFSYTDLNNTYFDGVPQEGVGSIKWNYPASTTLPIITQARRSDPALTIHNWYPRTELTPTLDLPLDGQGGTGSQVYNATSSSWLGTVSSGVTFTSGKEDNGAVFDNDADYIDINEAAAFSTYQKGTIEFWYKPTYTHSASDGVKRLVSSDNSSNQNELYVYVNNSLFECTMRDSGYTTRSASYNYYTTGALWQANEWVKITCAWDSTANGKNIRLYVNDQEHTYQTQQNASYTMGSPSASRTVSIGNNTSVDRTDSASGIIDSLRIYSEPVYEGILESGSYPNGKRYSKDMTVHDFSFDHPTSTPVHVFDRHDKGYVTASTLSSGVMFKAGHTGLGAAFEDDGDYLTLTQSAAGIATSTTIGFWYKNTTTTYSNLYYAHAFSMDSTEGSATFLRLHDPDQYNLYFNGANLIQEETVLPRLEDTGWHYIMTGWDADLGEAFIQVDGTRVTTSTTFYAPSYSGNFYIGNRSYSSQDREAQGIIDDFTIFDGYYRPYGAYDQDSEDVLFYWNADSAATSQSPQKGSGLVHVINATVSTTAVVNKGIEFNANGEYMMASSTGNIDASRGRLGFWYIPSTADVSDNKYLINFGDANDRLHIRRESNETLVFYYGDPYESANSSALVWATGTPYFIEASWDSVNDKLYLYRDGALIASDSDTQTAPTLQESMVFGNYGISLPNYPADGVIDEIYITRDPNTPINPTMDYKPIKMPKLAVGSVNSLTESTLGGDGGYNVVALNDITSYLITLDVGLQADTVWMVKENFTSSDLTGDFTNVGPVRLKKGIRLKGGIRLK